MKKVIIFKGEKMKTLLLLFALTSIGFGASDGAGHLRSTTLSPNGVTKHLGPNYGETNGAFFSDLAGVSSFALYNGSSLGSIAITFPLGSDDCHAGSNSKFTTKELVIPASSGINPTKPIAINKYACVRSKTGASIDSGDIELSVW